MTLGEKIKKFRIEKGISQEKMAEELKVSRSAIAKWETNSGIPEISNLILIAKIFHVSIDALVDDIKTPDTDFDIKAASNCCSYLGKNADVELDGWNDGVSNVIIINEDENFLFYQRLEKKKQIFGMIGKKYITSIRVLKETDLKQKDVEKRGRNYFCHKHVILELAKKEGFIKGFFDFCDDDYIDVIIILFDESTIKLEFGKEINLNEIAKIEELIS